MRAFSSTAKAVCVRGALTLSALVMFAGMADAGPFKRLFARGGCHGASSASCSARPASAVQFHATGTASVPPVRTTSYRHTVDVPDPTPAAVGTGDLIRPTSLPTAPCQSCPAAR